MEELDKDGDRRVNYEDFYTAMCSVVQRGAVDPDTVTRDVGLRESLLV